MSMEFIIFFLFMSIISFCMAFIAYGIIIKFLGTTSATSKYTQMIGVPVAVIAFDMITLAVPSEYRYAVGSIPLGVLGLFLVYFHFVKGGVNSNHIEPHEAIKKTSSKSLKHEQKKKAKQERIERSKNSKK